MRARRRADLASTLWEPSTPMRDPSEGRVGFWLAQSRTAAEEAGRALASKASLRLSRSLPLSHRLRHRFLSSGSEASSSDAESLQGTAADDAEFRELEERFGIVNKYDAGTEGQEVDPWENPNFELYQLTDRYGFVQNEGAHRNPRFEAALDAERRKELSREQKWLTMLSRWSQFASGSKMRSRIRKGIPDKLRAEVWRRLLLVPELRAAHSGVYEDLKSRARLLSRDIRQIDLDINRTYRNHLMFRCRYDIKQKSLLHVLAAYAMYNVHVGYCQGMSQLAAVLLMYMDEEDAFWGLHSLMTNHRHSMHGFFVPGFPKLLRYQDHYNKILAKYHPRLRKHMEKEGVPQIYTTKWFFGCYLDRVPFSLALRLWDVFIFEGEVVLSAFAHTILTMHAKILKRMDFEGMMKFLQEQLAEDFGCPNDVALEALGESLSKLKGDRMLYPAPPVDASLEAPPSETELGAALRRPMADIRSSISAIQSRHTSRAPSIAGAEFERSTAGRSAPSTPHSSRRRTKNRSGEATTPQIWRAPPDPERPQADKGVSAGESRLSNGRRTARSPVYIRDERSPAQGRDDRSPNHARDQQSPIHGRDQRSPIYVRDQRSPVQVGDQRSAIHVRDQRSPINYREHRSPVAEVSREQRSPEAGFSFVQPTLPRTPSVYDNVPAVTPTETLWTQRGRTSDGRGVVQSVYTRTQASVERREGVGLESRDVSYAPNHVTYVKVEPQRGPYASPTKSSSRQTVV